MAKQSQIEIIINGIDNFSKPITGAIDGIGKTVSGLATAGGIIAGAGAAAGAAIAGIAISAGMAAAEVEQLQMVTGLMADNAGWSAVMIDKQRDALRSSGITASGTEQALQALMAAELDVASATDLSRLAQNLAVKTGEDSTQTFLGLVSGIERADAQMLKSAGITVDLSKAQQALADELGKSVGELTAAEKQQAAWNAVIEKSPIYDGLYESAMEMPIKQIGSLKRLFNDVAVELGGHFTPMISDVIAGFSTFVKGIIEAISEGGALEPFLQALGAAFSWLGEQVGIAFLYMAENIPAFVAKVMEVWAWFQENEGVLVGILAAIGVAFVALAYTAIAALAPIIAGMLPVIAVMALVGAAAYLLYEMWTNNWGGIQEKTAAVIDFVKNVISTALAAIKAWWAEHGETIMATVQAMWNTVKNIFETVTGVILGIFQFFKAQFQILMSAFRSAAEGDWHSFGEKLRVIWDNIWEKIKEIFSKAWDWFKTAMAGLVKTIIDFFKNTDWGKVGTDIIKGIANGITGAVKFVVDAAKAAAKAAFDAAKGFLGIDSPSKLFMGIGENVSQGFAKGIENNLRLPEMAINKMSAIRPNDTLGYGTGTAGPTNNYYINMNSKDDPALTPTQAIKRLSMLYGAG
jgi:hypothetical protein